MIPDLIALSGSPWPVLPPGIHPTDLDEIGVRYATNMHRRNLFEGLLLAATNLRLAGSQAIYLDGSFVTNKPKPGDYDACFDPRGVVGSALDPVFHIFKNGRADQKAKFKGEFFPASTIEGRSGMSFLNFFQNDRYTGQAKGILEIPLPNDPMLLRRTI